MFTIKHNNKRTCIATMLGEFRWIIRTTAFDQMDGDLYWSGWDMIVTPVHRATPASIDVRDCIRDIMELL